MHCGLYWRDPTTMPSLDASEQSINFSDRWLSAGISTMSVLQPWFWLTLQGWSGGLQTQTMSADSSSERAELLPRVAVTTHMLCVCTRGWTWTAELCFSADSKAVSRPCHNYFFWTGNSCRIFVSELAVEVSCWWLPWTEVRVKYLPASTQSCSPVLRRDSCVCSYLVQLACLNSNLFLLIHLIWNNKEELNVLTKYWKFSMPGNI